MFFRRLVAICLLISYGIPASIGPHWHHHSHCGCDHSLTCSKTANQAVEAGCNCAFHRARAAEDSPSTKDSDRNHSKIGSHHSHGDCAICAFYAQAQTSNTDLCELRVSELIVDAADASVQSLDGLQHVGVARGPPSFSIG